MTRGRAHGESSARRLIAKGLLCLMLTTALAKPSVARSQGRTPSSPRTRFSTPAGSVVLLEESHDLPLVDFDFVLKTGSWHDPAGKEGLARLVARLVRMGTRRMTANQVEDAIDALGGQLTIDVAPSYVRFECSVIRRNLEPFVELVSTLLTEPAFRAEDLALAEREAVADIVEARDNDRTLAAMRFRRSLFGAHPYARPVIGTSTSVRAITRRDVQSFFREHYVAGNVVLGFAGDLTLADARRLASTRFGALPAGSSPAETSADAEPVHGRHVLVVDKPERTQTQIMIGSLGTSPRDRDHFPLLVANTVFGGTFTARLMKAIRSERGWSYGASSRLGIDRAREAFHMWTFPAATDAVACISLELELLQTLVRDGITQEELDFAKSFLVNSYAFDVDTASDRLEQRLDVEVYGLSADYYARYLERISAVTLAEANAALRRRLSADDLVIVLVATASVVRDGLAALPGVQAVDVVAFDQE